MDVSGQRRSERCGEKTDLAPAGNRTWAVQSVAIVTELFRLIFRLVILKFISYYV
jgi:hypothetical protein